VSPLVSTLILISIAIAGGLIVYGALYSWSGIMSAKAQLDIESVDFVKVSDGDVTFAITVKNSGSKPFDVMKITLPNGTETGDIITGTLQPGQSIGYSTTVTGTFVVGNTYTVTINGTCTDGSTFMKTISVQCRS